MCVHVCVCVCEKVAVLSTMGLFSVDLDSGSMWRSPVVPPLGTQGHPASAQLGHGVSVPMSGQAWSQGG